MLHHDRIHQWNSNCNIKTYLRRSESCCIEPDTKGDHIRYYLDLFAEDTCHVVHTPTHEGHYVRIQNIHSKAPQVWPEGDLLSASQRWTLRFPLLLPLR